MEILKKSLSDFRKKPFLFFVLQIPACLLEIFYYFTQDFAQHWQITYTILFLPLSFVVSFLTTAFTFLLLLELLQNRPISLEVIFQKIRPKIFLLLQGAILVGIPCGLGLIIILPGIYFCAVYLFVPHTIVFNEKAPILLVLHQAKKLSQINLKRNILIVGLLLVFIYGSSEGAEYIGENLLGPLFEGNVAEFMPLLFRSIITMTIGILIELSICHYYLKVRENETARKSS